MSTHLDQMIANARERSVDDVWDLDRAERVRTGTLRLRDGRARRDRALRRGLLVAGGAGLLVLVLLRGASSAPAEPQLNAATATSTATPAAAPTAEAFAARTLSDAGYARD